MDNGQKQKPIPVKEIHYRGPGGRLEKVEVFRAGRPTATLLYDPFRRLELVIPVKENVEHPRD